MLKVFIASYDCSKRKCWLSFFFCGQMYLLGTLSCRGYSRCEKNLLLWNYLLLAMPQKNNYLMTFGQGLYFSLLSFSLSRFVWCQYILFFTKSKSFLLFLLFYLIIFFKSLLYTRLFCFENQKKFDNHIYIVYMYIFFIGYIFL